MFPKIFINVIYSTLYFAGNLMDNTMKQYRSEKPFTLESGKILNGLTIAYHTYGEMNEDKSNVVWICHHLTANSDASLWWAGMVGAGTIIDPAKYFIVCANILGSCYGTTGPQSVDPSTGKPYYTRFPHITIRDMVKAHILLRKELGVERINLLIGGSMGGYQALEWAVTEPSIFTDLVLLSTSATESAWGIAVHTAQRMAIEADCTWKDEDPRAGEKGLKAARAIGLISYRNHGILVKKQTDPDIEKTDSFKASAYMEYQGEKLVSRFNTHSYWTLTKAMDSHHLARGRNLPLDEILRRINQRTLVLGIHSDILCPIPEQAYIAEHIPDSRLVAIDSGYGHDGFMVESEKISKILREWWK